MKSTYKILSLLIVVLFFTKQYGQTRTQLFVEVDNNAKRLNVQQKIIFHNESTDTITSIVLNDWNNAYSTINSPLAKRFSDEFYRGFHLASDEERGKTSNLTIIDDAHLFLQWERSTKNPDVISVKLRKKIAPNEKTIFNLTYVLKIPSDKFTKYGYTDLGGMNLKNWCITPARYENHNFVKNSNENLDDITNAIVDYHIDIKIPKNFAITTDLDSTLLAQDGNSVMYNLFGEKRTDFNLILEPKNTFEIFKNDQVEVVTNLSEKKLTAVEKSIVIDNVVKFVTQTIGKYPFKKIIVSQTDYERNPFYGLNQLPSFISPFSDKFTFEIKFLKTYLNNFLNNSLAINNRKDAWVHDAIQIYAMMNYIEEYHPNSKMLGSLSTYKLLKSYNLTNVEFNEQYSYLYMLMARKNLDQALGDSKNSLIKFNEQIASKYRAGISLRFLDNYLENNVVNSSIKELYSNFERQQISEKDFETILKKNSSKKIDWFFETIINSRKIIDYKFTNVTKTEDSISFKIKNKTDVIVPIPIYGIKKGTIVFKKWLEPNLNDSICTIERKEADKVVLNYKNEVPEYNLRNNWKSLKGFFPNNRPIKFAFMKDLEDPYYNQILYLPSMQYNLYDGLIPGMRLHNKTILEKPFTFDVVPAYSTLNKTLIGSGYMTVNQNYRNSAIFNVKYSFSGSYYHYAKDATYSKINPTVQLLIRDKDLRDNHKQVILFRHVFINREKSLFTTTNNNVENYSVFNAKYFNTNTQVTKHFKFMSEIQLSNKFNKVATEIEYRKLFENGSQMNLRFYAGSFLNNNSNSDFFSFSLDRPTDYMFDYNFYGRSESKGFFSQQLIIAEGGFKSKLNIPFSNQWMTTINGGYTIWNWIEAYSDLGILKNNYSTEKILFDSGIRFNLVTDYFEVYFPVYSSNGWEIGQKNYNEKIRFVITLSPKILVNLFNRKWF